MTDGEDVGLNEIELMNAMTLFGRFGGSKYKSEGLNLWVANSWKDVISQMPAVYLLPRGWITFKFLSEEDVPTVLAGVWRWDKTGLLIKRGRLYLIQELKGMIKCPSGLNFPTSHFLVYRFFLNWLAIH